MRFIDGLREDLCATVPIQQPSDLDTAFVLAQLQDEVVVPTKRKESKKHDYGFSYKQDLSSSSQAMSASKSRTLFQHLMLESLVLLGIVGPR
jgi:hypothetical protein